ncbi:MAG: hypothetical protein PHW13_06625 [Methylococcales bacterium]|nr:hypothetical protein [Methylococcales bacterium]
MKSIRYSLLAVLMSASAAANAAPVLYNLSETFTDGSSFTGSLDFDSSTNAITNFQGVLDEFGVGIYTMTTETASGVISGQSYAVTSVNIAGGFVQVSVNILDSPFGLYSPFSESNYYYDSVSNHDVPANISTASFSAAGAVPEPASLTLLLAGLWGLARYSKTNTKLTSVRFA